MKNNLIKILSIGGSDPSGGAGVQADIKVFQQYALYGQAVISCLTAQDSQEVRSVFPLSHKQVHEQLNALPLTPYPLIVKTGALGGSEAVTAVIEFCRRRPCILIIDPVIYSSSGMPLLDSDGLNLLINSLLPLAQLVTPNLDEAAELIGESFENSSGGILKAAKVLLTLGPANVLITGGHREDSATDILQGDEGTHYFEGEKIPKKSVHGTGCGLSAAVAAGVARGLPLPRAIAVAKDFISRAIATATPSSAESFELNFQTVPDLTNT